MRQADTAKAKPKGKRRAQRVCRVFSEKSSIRKSFREKLNIAEGRFVAVRGAEVQGIKRSDGCGVGGLLAGLRIGAATFKVFSCSVVHVESESK